MLRRSWKAALFGTLVSALSLSVLLRASTGTTPMLDAAKLDDKEAVRALVKQGADVNAAEGDGMTALHWAAAKGEPELADILVHAGANVKAITRVGSYTPLHMAAKIGSVSVMDVLLKAGADVNAATVPGTTPLMLAAAAGNPEGIRLLAARGANLDAREPAKGHTALMFAAAANRADAVRALAQLGADTRATTTVFDLTHVEMPPDRSAQNNADAKARLEASAASGNPSKKLAVAGVTRGYEYNELVAAQGGLTALLFAARQGHFESVQALLETGADINQVSAGVNISPLVIAIVNGRFDLAMYLLEKGANPNLAAENGVAPLYAALNCQWSDTVEYPQPQAYLQQKTSHLDLLKALLDKGADPNLRLKKKVWYSGYARDNSGVDEVGASAFWRAIYASDLDAARILAAHGADTSLPTLSPPNRPPAGAPGMAPLHAATGAGYLQNYAGNGHRTHPAGWMPAVKYLVEELGADVNIRDHEGNTPLHYAAARGDNEMILYLISKGADVMVANKAGQSTVDAANGPHQRVQPYPETIKLLEGLGATKNKRCVSC
jgi:ankyrin repeat protein